MPQIVDATLKLLREESACQLIESDSDNDEDDTEHDEILMDAVSDLLPAFAKALGPHFAPIFATLFEPLMKFAVSGVHSGFRYLLMFGSDYGTFLSAENFTPFTGSNYGGCQPCRSCSEHGCSNCRLR